ncbi:MAG: hypothetical protein IPJ32_19950 [Sphingobacteriaceae bacterium]|nr:hypothetical protein [Sphingobacteriaceae bacterium]
MVRLLLILIFVISLGTTLAQTTSATSTTTPSKKKGGLFLFPIISGDYVYQGIHSFSGSLGPGFYYGRRHSYFGGTVGFNVYFNNKANYLVPVYYIEKFFQIKTKKGFYGPLIKIGYCSYKLSGQRDNYFSGDLGFKFYFVTLLGGYNLLVDGKKDLNSILPYRIGLKFCI